MVLQSISSQNEQLARSYDWYKLSNRKHFNLQLTGLYSKQGQKMYVAKVFRVFGCQSLDKVTKVRWFRKSSDNGLFACLTNGFFLWRVLAMEWFTWFKIVNYFDGVPNTKLQQSLGKGDPSFSTARTTMNNFWNDFKNPISKSNSGIRILRKVKNCLRK